MIQQVELEIQLVQQTMNEIKKNISLFEHKYYQTVLLLKLPSIPFAPTHRIQD